jgi:pyrimidine operon attenuation protein / uracil phosphoribosyltransferase
MGIPPMNSEDAIPQDATVLMDAPTMAAHLDRMAREIAEGNPAIESLVLLGILRRGRPLADRLAQLIGGVTGFTPQVGSLATTLYRDDYRSGAGVVKPRGTTYFDFNVNDRTVLLVDDVLAAGRTIRAAMDEVMDYGRPTRIQLACLIDRGLRELPIQADYLGWPVATKPEEWISVRLMEMDGEDAVLLHKRIHGPGGIPDGPDGREGA